MTTIDKQLEAFNREIEKIESMKNTWYKYHHSQNGEIIWIQLGYIHTNKYHEVAHTTIAIHSNGNVIKVPHRI